MSLSRKTLVVAVGIGALQLFPMKPIFGAGPDTFLSYVNYSTGFNAHQTWMRLLIETGLVGLAAFLGLVGTVSRKLWLLYRRGRDRDPLLVPLMAAWIAMLAGSLAGDPFALPSVVTYLWVMVALVVAGQKTETV